MSQMKELQIKVENINILCNNNNLKGKSQWKVLTKRLPVLNSNEAIYLKNNLGLNFKNINDKYSLVYKVTA